MRLRTLPQGNIKIRTGSSMHLSKRAKMSKDETALVVV